MVAYSGTRDLQAAQSFFEQSLELYQRNGDPWGNAFVSFHLGMIAVERNEDALALSLLGQSMDLFHQLGDVWGQGKVSQLLGQLFLKQGNYEKARLYFEQHLKLDEALHFKEGTVIALANLGDLYRYQGDYDLAEQFYGKGLSTCREYGLRRGRGYNLYSLGMLGLHRSNYLLAKQFFTDYYNLSRGIADKTSTADFLTGLAAVASGLNEPERAATLSGAAQTIFDVIDYRIPPFDQAELDRHIQIARGQLGEARFEAFAAEGRAITIEQAIEYALGLSKSP